MRTTTKNPSKDNNNDFYFKRKSIYTWRLV